MDYVAEALSQVRLEAWERRSIERHARFLERRRGRISTVVQLLPDQADWVRCEAKRQGRSVAYIVRDLLIDAIGRRRGAA